MNSSNPWSEAMVAANNIDRENLRAVIRKLHDEYIFYLFDRTLAWICQSCPVRRAAHPSTSDGSDILARKTGREAGLPVLPSLRTCSRGWPFVLLTKTAAQVWLVTPHLATGSRAHLVLRKLDTRFSQRAERVSTFIAESSVHSPWNRVSTFPATPVSSLAATAPAALADRGR